MEIIKLFWINIFMPVTKFPCLTTWLFCQRRPIWIFGQFRGLLEKTNSNSWKFCPKFNRAHLQKNSELAQTAWRTSYTYVKLHLYQKSANLKIQGKFLFDSTWNDRTTGITAFAKGSLYFPKCASTNYCRGTLS